MTRFFSVSGLLAAGMAAFLLAAPLSAGEILSNADIINLTRASLPEDIIINAIRGSAATFDLSSRSIVTLKNNGVSDEVIRAMQAQSAQTSAPRTPSLRPSGDADRFRAELENIASDANEARDGGLAWMQANREQSLPGLRQALGHSRPEIRAAAIAALSRLNDRESLPAMRNMLSDASPEVRRSAARALVAMDDIAAVSTAEQAVSRQFNPLDGYVRLVGYARLTQAAGPLATILGANRDPINRAAAAWALGEIGRAGTAGRQALENALASDSDPNVRREAASAVAKFHDSQAAKALQDACARDPEVRRITLAAMAEYPETVEFLVGVMTLGPDQIAADELETARASLARLTVRDFGMDGERWSEWFAANRSSFPSGIASAPASPASSSMLASHPGPALQPRAPEVDIEAWSIVADSSGIPMAPQVDDRGPMPPVGGFPAAPPLGTGGSGSVGPSALAPGEFSAAATSPRGFGPGAGVPTDIPDMLRSDAPPGQPSGLRTWSSDPSRGPRPSTGALTPSREALRSSSPRSSFRPAAEPDSPPAAAFGPASEPARSAMPAEPVVPRYTPSPASSSDALSGISLPMPPLGDGDGYEAAPSGGVVASPAGDGLFPDPDPYAASGGGLPPGVSSVQPGDSGGFSPDAPFQGADTGGGSVLRPEWVEIAPRAFDAPGASVSPGGGFSGVDSGPPPSMGGDAGFMPPFDEDPGFMSPFDENPDFMPPIGEGMIAADPFGPPIGGTEAPAYEDPVPQIGGMAAEPETSMPVPGAMSDPDEHSLNPAADLGGMPPLPFAEDSGTPATPAAPAAPTAPTAPTAPPALPDAGEGAPSAPEAEGSNLVFVEPEPGQVVIGEVLLLPGQTASPQTYEAPAPSYEAPSSETPSTPAPPAMQTSAPAFVPPDEYIVNEEYITPPPGESLRRERGVSARSSSRSGEEQGPPPSERRSGTVTAPPGRDLPPMLGEGMFTK